MMSTEGFTSVQSFYCSVITSLSAGYGDFYPLTQGGRLAFAFYIPTSVSVVLGAVGQLLVLYRRMHLVHVVKRVPVDKIFELDIDGDGVVSKAEYVLWMLRETREVDEELLKGYESQFKALDTDGSGSRGSGCLSVEDFPDKLENETTSVVLNKKKIESAIWNFVLKKPPYSKRQKAPIANRNDSPTATPPIAPFRFLFEETIPCAIGQKKVPQNPAKGTSSSGGGGTGVVDQLEGAREFGMYSSIDSIMWSTKSHSGTLCSPAQLASWMVSKYTYWSSTHWCTMRLKFLKLSWLPFILVLMTPCSIFSV
jgi:hypothetical protein